ncbi:MAG: hypothetical protein AB1779_08840 [Candidatus Thermoplasmatota archaeon]
MRLFGRKKKEEEKVTPPPEEEKEEVEVPKAKGMTEEELLEFEKSLKEREAKLEEKEGELRTLEEALKLEEEELAKGKPAPKEEKALVPALEISDEMDVPELEGLIKRYEENLGKARERLKLLKEEKGEREKFNKELERYRKEGYVVTRLEEVMKKDIATLKKAFDDFASDVETLSAFGERISELSKVFEKEVAEIEDKLKDPSAIPEIEEVIASLEEKMEGRVDEIKRKIDEFKKEGYVVTRVEKLLGGAIGELEKEFVAFEEDIQVLKMFSDKIKKYEKNFPSEVFTLRGMLENPDNIPEIEAKLTELEEKIGSRLKEFTEKMQQYKDGGYVVSRLEAVMDKDIGVIEKEFVKFEEDIQRLKLLGEKLTGLDKAYEKEIAAIRSKLTDPDAIGVIGKEILELKEKIRKKGEVAKKEEVVEKKVEVPKPVAPAVPEGEDLGRKIDELEGKIKELSDQGIDMGTGKNMIRLAKTFLRGKNYEKATYYAQKVEKAISDAKAKK